MLKIAMTAAAALVALAGAARAQDPAVTTQQGCFNMVDGLAQSYENNKYAKKYANSAQADKLGAALKALEKQCEDNKFADAQKAAAGLKGDITLKP